MCLESLRTDESIIVLLNKENNRACKRGVLTQINYYERGT